MHYSFFTGSWFLEARWSQLRILCVTVKTAVPSGLSSGFFPASLQESTCASVSMWLFRPRSILSCQLALLKRMDVLGNKSVNAKEEGLIIKVSLYSWAIWSPINNKAKGLAEKSSFSAILVQKYKKKLLYFSSPFNTFLSFVGVFRYTWALWSFSQHQTLWSSSGRWSGSLCSTEQIWRQKVQGCQRRTVHCDGITSVYWKSKKFKEKSLGK